MRDDLYEQCSDHITEKTPSSTRLGSRPSNSLMRLNSSGVRLCVAITSGVIDSINHKAGSRKEYCLRLSAHCFIDCVAKFDGVNTAEMFEDDFTFLVVQKCCRQLAVP